MFFSLYELLIGSQPTLFDILLFSGQLCLSGPGYSTACLHCDKYSNLPHTVNTILLICIGNSMICSDIWHKYHE